MPTVKGNLLFVSSRVAQVSEVWVRAPKVRTHAEGLVTTGNDHFPVIDGQVEFTAVPGPAVLALISQGRAVDTVPIVVGESDSQTLRQVVNAAEIADDATKREIEKLSAQAIHLVDSSTENARKAQDGAQRAETAAGEAGDAADRASSSASSANRTSVWVSQAKDRVEEFEASAKESAQTATTQASSAEDSASAAKSSAMAAAASESGAKASASAAESSATAASSSVSQAAESEQTAGKFATQESAANRSESSADAAASSESSAAGSAEEAKSHADRAANVADSTSWEGDRLTVNGQTSPPLTGPKGDPSDVTKDQLDTAIASEKARTVGMVWMVETEDQAQTKETSCQKGDFIQVAETGNIYQVV